MAWEEVVRPILSQFKPGAILVSLGGDAHYMDPLANLTLSSLGYVNLAEKLIQTANRECDGRISFYLEGGYHLSALADMITGIIGRFHNIKTPIFFSEVYDLDTIGKDIIKKVKEIQGSYWSL